MRPICMVENRIFSAELNEDVVGRTNSFLIALRREISSLSKGITQLICSIFNYHRAVMLDNFSLSRVCIINS